MFTKQDVLFTLIIGGTCMLGGGYAGMQAKKLDQANNMPTQTEIQTILHNAGYDLGSLGVDGKIGRDSRLAWDKYIAETRHAQNSHNSTK